MPTAAKICGLSTPEAVAAALGGKAGWLGFVFFAKGPRYVTAETAARLASRGLSDEGKHDFFPGSTGGFVCRASISPS